MSHNHLAVSHNRRSRRKLRYAAVAGAATAGLLNAHGLFAQPVFPPDSPTVTGYTFTANVNDVWSDNGQWDPGDSSNLPPASGGQNVAVWLNPSGGTGTTVTLDTAVSAPAGTYQLNSLWLGGTNNAPLTLVGDSNNPSLVFGPDSNNTLPTITLAGSSTSGVTIATPISLSNMSVGQALTFNSVTNAAGVYNTLAILGAISGTGDLSFQTAGCGSAATSLTIAGYINNNGNVTFSSTTTNTSNIVITGALANAGSLYFNNLGTVSYTNAAGIPNSITNLTITTNVAAITIAGNIDNSGPLFIATGTTATNVTLLGLIETANTISIGGGTVDGGPAGTGIGISSNALTVTLNPGGITGALGAVTVAGGITNTGNIYIGDGTSAGKVTIQGPLNATGNIYIQSGYLYTGTSLANTIDSNASPGGGNWYLQGGALVIGCTNTSTVYVGTSSSSVLTITGGGIGNQKAITLGNNISLGGAMNIIAGNDADMTLSGNITTTASSSLTWAHYSDILYLTGVLAGTSSFTLAEGGTKSERLYFDGTQANTITGALNMYGNGILYLNLGGAYNAFNGALNIGTGTMNPLSNSATPPTVTIVSAYQQIPLGSSNIVTIAGASLSPGTYSGAPGVLNLDGNNQTIGMLQGSGIIGTSKGTPTLTLKPCVADTFNGIIAYNIPTSASAYAAGTQATLVYDTGGSVQVNINGSALQTLGGANTYNLGTLIVTNSAGLQITNAQALGSGSVTVSAPLISNFAGSLTNTVNLVTGGTLYGVGSSGFTGFSGTVMPNGGSVNLTDYVAGTPLNITMSGPLTGTGALIVTGTSGASGILNLSGANTYTGGTKVLNGTLQTGNMAALGYGGTILTVGQTLASATTTVTNGGTLDLNGQNITEPITLNGGTLTNSGSPATLNNGVLGTTFSGTPSNTFSSSSTASYSGGAASATAQIYLGFTTASISIPTGDGGSGYTKAPTVTLSAGDPTGIVGAVLTATEKSGVVTKINITTAGEYTPAQMAQMLGTNSITITGVGTGAVALVSDSDFTLTAIEQSTPGSGYMSSPTVTYANGGTATTAVTLGSLTLTGNNTITGVTGGDIYIPAVISGAGNFNKTGSNNLYLTNNNNSLPGGFTLTSGSVTAQSALGYGSVLGTSAANAGPINLAGGTLAIYDDGAFGGVSGAILNYRNAVNAVSSSTLSVNPVSKGSNNTIAFGALALTTANNPTLTLTNGNNYGVSFTKITGGGTLCGAVPVSVTGLVQPGDGPAILNVNNLSVASSGTFAAEITGPGWQSPASTNAGINYDQINVTGASALSLGADTVLNILLGSTNVAGNYYLVNESAGNSADQFHAVDFNGTLVTPNGSGDYNYTYNSVPLSFTLSYFGNIVTGDNSTGYDVVLGTVGSPVPEPSSLALLALGSMGLLARRRRSRTPRKAD